MFILFASFNAYVFDFKRMFKSLIFKICQKEALKSTENVIFIPSNLVSSKMPCRVWFKVKVFGVQSFPFKFVGWNVLKKLSIKSTVMGIIA